MLWVATELLDALEYSRIEGNSIEDAVAVKTIKNIENDKWEKWAHKAEEKDFERNAAFFWTIGRLARYTSYLEMSPALKEYIFKKLDEQQRQRTAKRSRYLKS